VAADRSNGRRNDVAAGGYRFDRQTVKPAVPPERQIAGTALWPTVRATPARNRFEPLPAPAIHSRGLNYKEFMHTTVCMVTATLAGSFGVGPALFWGYVTVRCW
jgi:hypothetical protein